MLRQHQVGLWLPETYGPVDFGDPRHLAVIDVLGVRSQREVSRARYRTTAAMRAQVQIQGRLLGGRPPYRYRLVGAGPHPNRTHALITTLTGHTREVYAVAFSPDGTTLASASGDHTIRLWNVATHAPITTLTGHTDVVNHATFNTVGTIIASSSDDGTIKLWRIK